MKGKCCVCGNIMVEELLVDEECDEVFCQTCWDKFDESEKDGSMTHAFTEELND